MKKTVILLALMLSSTMTLAQDHSEVKASAASGGAQMESKTNMNDEINASKKWEVELKSQSYSMVNDIKENSSQALIESDNAISFLYEISDKAKLGVGHHFTTRLISDRSQLEDFKSDNGSESAYRTDNPSLRFNYKMPSLLGSDEYTLETRYFVPVSEEAREHQSNGLFRTETFITWKMTSHFELGFYGDARLYLNSEKNAQTEVGSDSILRTKLGPSAGYNLNSTFGVYYCPYLDMKSTGFQRGQWNADLENNLVQEIGLYISLAGGKYTINPAWATTAKKLGNSSYIGAGDDSSSEYDLNLAATF